MSGKPLVLFGLGELSEIAAYYFENDGNRRIAAFTIDGERMKDTSYIGRPVVAFEEIEQALPPDKHDLFVAVGYSRINGLRQAKCEASRAKGYALASYVSSRATVFGNVVSGWNCFILEDNTVQPFVRIGNGVTLWSGNHIGHHAVIGDFVFISSHVVISGGVKVGERTFIGVNSTTNDHISIGALCVIGSGSLITKDLADESVVSAEPAKLSPVPSRRLKGF
jgi:sugar O-acyltransferase (sialic acid O-acetyltransferase NeuD family)